jgi:D-sedoheptulose 7-phosphate isomerase
VNGPTPPAEPTGFLYPFIEAEERDSTALLEDLKASAEGKIRQSATLRRNTLDRCAQQIEAAASAAATRFGRGGRLFTFGNGGSATDAQGAATLFRQPPSGRALPALSLVEDQAVLTALSNDVGFELVFSRQLIAHAVAGDVALGFSTSGDSPNMLRAFEEADRRGLLTVGLCGYEGSGMAVIDAVHHCLVVRSDSVHRIQETQDALTLELWRAVQRHLDQDGSGDVRRPA